MSFPRHICTGFFFSPLPTLLLVGPLIFLSILHFSLSTHVQSDNKGFISVSISKNGLDFVKDLLVQRAVSLLTPLELPPIEKQVKIPVVGKVRIVLSDITIYHVTVPSSSVESEESGISISAVGATAYLSMNWEYSYRAWVIDVSDSGKASVQVEGMEVGLTVSLKSQEGALKLSLMEYGCTIKDIEIQLDGGASWLYQGLVDAFSEKIGSVVEDAISKKIKEGILKVDARLQSLPREIPVDETSALNVTLVGDPSFSDYSVDIGIDGLFVLKNKLLMSKYHHGAPSLISREDPTKMVTISLHEDVLNSASLIYFTADLMRWNIDKLPDQYLLNTSTWRNVLPELYRQFPNDSMNLDILVTLPPSVDVSEQGISVSIDSDVTLGVCDGEKDFKVASVSVVIGASGSAQISKNNLTGSIDLENINLSLKWSNIGDFDLDMVQLIISQVIRDALLPRLNTLLMRGFPLPLIRGFTLQDAEIRYTKSRIVSCGDVAFVESHGPQLGFLSWPFATVNSFGKKAV